MGMIISTVGEVENIRWAQLQKGRVVKCKRVLAFNDSNHAIIELENGQYTVIGGRHGPNGNWAVLSYGLDHFTQKVLYGLVRLGILDKKQVAEHIRTADARDKASTRRSNIRRLLQLCEELGLDPPVVKED